MPTLATSLEAVGDRIEAQTSLTRSKQVDTVRNTPDHLHDRTFSAWPDQSRNANVGRPSGSSVVSDDRVLVELVGRLVGADEVGSLDTALAVAESVRIALTSASWYRSKSAGADLMCMTWVNDRLTREGGWVIIAQTYTMRRQGVLG